MTVQAPVERKALLPYVIVRSGISCLELLRVSLESGEEVLPVFSSGEAAWRFLLSGAFGEGWRVKGCSAGELVSLLFGPCATIERLLPNPLSEPLTAEDEVAAPVYRESFIASLLGSRGVG